MWQSPNKFVIPLEAISKEALNLLLVDVGVLERIVPLVVAVWLLLEQPGSKLSYESKFLFGVSTHAQKMSQLPFLDSCLQSCNSESVDVLVRLSQSVLSLVLAL